MVHIVKAIVEALMHISDEFGVAVAALTVGGGFLLAEPIYGFLFADDLRCDEPFSFSSTALCHKIAFEGFTWEQVGWLVASLVGAAISLGLIAVVGDIAKSRRERR